MGTTPQITSELASDVAERVLERRRSPRARVLGTVKLVFGFNKTVLDCVTVDQSREGIRVRTESPHVLPDDLWAQFPFGRPIRAKLRWVSCLEAGLELFPDEAVIIRGPGSVTRD